MVKNLPAESLFFPGKFCGQRSLIGYSPWGHKELDTTEHVRAHTHTDTIYARFLSATAFEFITTTCVSI